MDNLQPLPCMLLSGRFTQSQVSRHFSQKESFLLICSFKRVQWILFGYLTPLFFYTDHKSLLTVIRPKLTDKTTYLEGFRRRGLQLQNLHDNWAQLLLQIKYLFKSIRMARHMGLTADYIFLNRLPVENSLANFDGLVYTNNFLKTPGNLTRYLETLEKMRKEWINELTECLLCSIHATT